MQMVLDLGCGNGESLNAELRLSRTPHTSQMQAVGVDISLEILLNGKQRYPAICFVCARGEQLPFRDESFQTVFSQVAMPYMDIPVTLREVRRVLKTGGELRMKLHPFSYTRSELLAELREGSAFQRLKNLVYRLYVMANGIALHLLGINFRFPLARRRCESFQTERGIRRVLAATGFRQVDIPCWVTKIVRPHAGDCRAIAVR